MLSRSVQRKKFEKKGVDSLFSPDEGKGRPGLFIGYLSILVGFALWTVNIAGVHRPGYFGQSGLNSYTSLVLAPLGLLFVVSGVAVSLSLRNGPSSASTQKLADDVDRLAQLPPSTRRISIVKLRLGIVAFLESLLIVTLYAGILDEYQSNVGMQDWVRRTLPTAQILLSYEALIIASGILALVVVQFLPGRRFYEKGDLTVPYELASK